MRAATRTGMIFVGPPMGQRMGQPEPKFAPKAIKPNPTAGKAREAFRAVYRRWVKQTENLIAEAVCEEEASYWRQELKRFRRVV